MDNSEYPILKSILVRNRSLLIHVTGDQVTLDNPKTALETVVNKVSWLLLGKNENAPNNKPRGKIIVLREDEPGSLTFAVKDQIDLLDAPTCASFDSSTCTLSVGYLSGNIDCFVLTPENNYTRFKLFTSIRQQKSPIRCLETQGLHSSIIVVSRDNAITAFDISSESNFKVDEVLSPHKLTAISYDSPSDNLFLGTDAGEFLVYTFQGGRFTLEARVTDGLCDDIVGFYVEPKRRYLFVSYRSGFIYAYEVLATMRSYKDFVQTCVYEVKNEITTLCMNSRQKMLLVGDSCGLISFIDMITSDTVLVMDLFEGSISTILLFNDDHALLVSAHSRACHILSLPDAYISNELPNHRVISNIINKHSFVELSNPGSQKR